MSVSKFANFMHLFDMKNAKLIVRVMDKKGNLKPKDPQEEVYIPVTLPKLNSMCEKCTFCSVCTTSGFVNEMGINGYASNHSDTEISDHTSEAARIAGKKVGVGLKQIANASQKDFRTPRAIVIAEGQMWACYNRRNTDQFLLAENCPGCAEFKEKVKPKI